MTLSEKLNVIQTRLKAPKGQYNSFGKYNYRSCEDILEGLKPLLEETKTTIRLSDTVEIAGSRIYIKATATLSDGESEISTTAYARESESKKGMDDSQVTGTASSYARKYALNGLLAIDDTKDADTMNNGSNSRQDTQRNAPAPQKPKATASETMEIKALLDSRDGNGNPVFNEADKQGFRALWTEKSPAEVIAAVKAERNRRIMPPEVNAVAEAVGGEAQELF